MTKNLLVKLLAVSAGMMPLSAWCQESGLAPGRLGLGEAERDKDVALTAPGQVLPGDLGSAIPDDLEALEEVTPEDEQRKLESQLPESVMALKPAQRMEILRLLQEAATFIQGIRLQEGLDRLIQIEAITPDLYQTYNLRGAIFTKLRDFDTARAAFKKALELKPGLMEAMFNLAELDFVEKHFVPAEKAFRKLKADFPGLRPETIKLIDYKLFITVLLQSGAGDAKEKQAMGMLDGFDFLDDYPVFYYGKAALAFHQDNKEEAEEWMASARRIYDKATQTIYIDALIEMGWVESL
ncbi:MAG: tetratricopeptide (TPR) repeat protein [Verrucomicrobiales bacterium]|jgi:tetratricopeptide (TPR) repeat protein